MTYPRLLNIYAGLTATAIVYRDEKARSRAMSVVLSGKAAGALGKPLSQTR